MRFDDYRNAVHDSDGLQIVNGSGERLWRPLANPRTLQVSAFLDDSPKGFGLIQRKRSEERTSELQSRLHLVCRLLLEKKKILFPDYYTCDRNVINHELSPISQNILTVTGIGTLLIAMLLDMRQSISAIRVPSDIESYG